LKLLPKEGPTWDFAVGYLSNNFMIIHTDISLSDSSFLFPEANAEGQAL